VTSRYINRMAKPFHLKFNMLMDYTRTFNKEILPLLRKQNGFKDEISFSGPSGRNCD
jgi:hypothetical protein